MLLCFWDDGFRDTKPTRDQEHPVESADDLEGLEIVLNMQAAAGYHAIKIDQKCDCDNPQSSGDGYVVIAARSDFDRGKYVELL